MLTLLVSIVTTIASIPYVVNVVYYWDEAANFTADPLSRFVVTFFLVFLLLDVIIGNLHYKDQFDFLTGWVHHGSYLLFFGWLRYSDYTIGARLVVIWEHFSARLILTLLILLFLTRDHDNDAFGDPHCGALSWASVPVFPPGPSLRRLVLCDAASLPQLSLVPVLWSFLATPTPIPILCTSDRVIFYFLAGGTIWCRHQP